MIKFIDFWNLLNNFCPLKKSKCDDNSGIQIALPNQHTIKKVLIALDANNKVINQGIENKIDLIITHHPLFWPTKRIGLRSTETRKKYNKLKKAKIGVISLHTNYDDLYLKQDLMNFIFNDIQCDNSLPLISMGKISKTLTLKQIIQKIKKIFELNTCFYYGNLQQKISTIALMPGAGGGTGIEMAKKNNVDLYITGEMKWNDWIKVQEARLSVIVIGHQMEEIFTQKLIQHLKKIKNFSLYNLDFQHFFHGTIKKNLND